MIKLALEDWCRSEMVWGKDDCALAIANIDKIVLGYDPAQDFRGRYKTERGAKRVLGKSGLIGALRRAAKRYHWLRVKVSPLLPSGTRGIAILPLGPTVMIKYSKGFWVGRSSEGFASVGDDDIKYAWQVA